MAVDDLYRPYRPKRRTRATIAKERGLEPLANVLLLQQLDHPAQEEAAGTFQRKKVWRRRRMHFREPWTL